MIRYETDRMLADAASVKPTKACPEWAGGPCIKEPPNEIKKEEPKAGTSGLLGRESSTLNPCMLEQKQRVGNKDSELHVPRGPVLVDELERELNTTRLRDENLGIREGETVRGTLDASNAGIHWRFFDEDVKFIEPGSSYHVWGTWINWRLTKEKDI
jgi:hypothetical protein